VSVKEGKVVSKRKGSEPNNVASTHPKVTIKKPSRCDICFFRGLKKPSSKRPVNMVVIAAGKKDR
jgi:DNA gyrase inhibitor GyrI